MNIEGLSEKTIEKMVEELNITKIHQIYDITKDDLMSLEGFKDKKTEKILSAIKSSKKTKLDSFIYALGIPNVGKKTSFDLVQEFKTLENIRNAKFEDLIRVTDVGDITAEAIVEFFHEQHIVNSLEILLDKGINFEEIQENASSELEGVTIVVTGTIEGYNRKEIEEKLRLKGAKVTGSVSKSTIFYLLVKKQVQS